MMCGAVYCSACCFYYMLPDKKVKEYLFICLNIFCSKRPSQPLKTIITTAIMVPRQRKMTQ